MFSCDVHENVQCYGEVACVYLEEVRLCDVYIELQLDGCV